MYSVNPLVYVVSQQTKVYMNPQTVTDLTEPRAGVDASELFLSTLESTPANLETKPTTS